MFLQHNLLLSAENYICETLFPRRIASAFILYLWYVSAMKFEIFEVVSELICVASLLGRDPPDIAAAQIHLDDARGLLLKLDDALVSAESN
jgi:hypothetical protein